MFSFYHLPSTVVKHPIHRILHVAYSFYNVSMVTPLRDLMLDALVIAKEVSLVPIYLLSVFIPACAALQLSHQGSSAGLGWIVTLDFSIFSWGLTCSIRWM